ncbi:HD domain-containing protein [Aliikangiella sp. IMCC44359]|uniref:HD domain-containing protein n=1 Tax=Aliikangiella sp. IMCC44359 TaxID=3459125 RepID=UPI00403AC4CF
MLTQKLNQRFINLINQYSQSNIENSSLNSTIIHTIFNYYTESHRKYHNLNHLEQMFKALEKCPVNNCIMQWSTWFHDIIYQPGSSHNEEKSAALAKKIMCTLNIPQNEINQTIHMILATKAHHSNSNDQALLLFLDTDMSILGANKDNYQKYIKAIRIEHQHIPDLIFYPARKRFLNKTLERENIFLTQYFRDKYEDNARGNIKLELKNI